MNEMIPRHRTSGIIGVEVLSLLSASLLLDRNPAMPAHL
jgi:hypothetical protein